MRSRWLLNVCLLALVALLSVIVIYNRGADKAEPPTLLTALNTDDINTIRIEGSDSEPTVLKKSQDTWSMVIPLRARTNSFNVRSILRLAVAPSEMRWSATIEDLSKYGLDNPKTRVRLDNAEIQLGARHPFKNAQYVLYDGAVHLVAAPEFNSSSYSYANLISPRLLEEDLKPVAFELPDLRLRLKDGKWELHPKNKAVTADRINQFVNEWRFARALTVERYAGEQERGRIRITARTESADEKDVEYVIELAILRYQPQFVVYRKDEGLEYRFTEDTAKRLLDFSAKEE